MGRVVKCESVESREAKGDIVRVDALVANSESSSSVAKAYSCRSRVDSACC
jgi:hypothetical protein